jgi:hypothetical protein
MNEWLDDDGGGRTTSEVYLCVWLAGVIILIQFRL